jgi:murein DD-endopeptidase MepM/ murein hydrolase activator NlpD
MYLEKVNLKNKHRFITVVKKSNDMAKYFLTFFVVNTKNLLTDNVWAAKQIKNLIILIFFTFFFKNLYALELRGKFYQGNLIVGKVEAGLQVFIDEKKIKISNEGIFVFGLSKERKKDIVIEVIENDTSVKIIKKILKKKYKVQRIDNLPKKQVTPPKEVYERIKNDNKLIAEARLVNSNLTFFSNKFQVPLKNSIITGVYGSQRILNGIPKSPHYGLDFAAKEGTEIQAMLDGTVTLAEKNLYYTGGTITFDHGHGISTLYMHLKDINVKKGQKIKQGDIIGTVGKTGRSTGAHLDIRLNWFGAKLDPASVLKLN